MINRVSLIEVFMNAKRQYWRSFFGFWWRQLLLAIPLTILSFLALSAQFLIHFEYVYVLPYSSVSLLTFLVYGFEVCGFGLAFSQLLLWPARVFPGSRTMDRKPVWKKVIYIAALCVLLCAAISISLSLSGFYLGNLVTLPLSLLFVVHALFSFAILRKFEVGPFEAFVLAARGVLKNWMMLGVLTGICFAMIWAGTGKILRWGEWYGLMVLPSWLGLALLFLGLPFCILLFGNAFHGIYATDNVEAGGPL